MTKVDILGTGAGVNIIGKITKGKYDGLLFSKQDTRSTAFPNNYIVVDVKEFKGGQVIAHTVSRFKEDSFSPDSITCNHYLILENKPLFVPYSLPIDDLK